MMKRRKECAYCGRTDGPMEKEHVIPRTLYPASRTQSKVQRLTVPSCPECNRGFSDAEAHFRNVILAAGEPNDAVREIWNDRVRRSFQKPDGQRRRRELAVRLSEIATPEGPRHVIYPDRDPLVMTVVNKIVRGLSYHHALPYPVLDEQIQSEVLKHDVPDEILGLMEYHHREADIFDYSFVAEPVLGVHSFWLLRFVERRTFGAIVRSSV